MAEIFKFFNSAPGDERWHYASDFADYFGDVLSSGLLHKDGTPNLLVKVNHGTMQTIIEPGKALMQGYQYKNTTPLFLTHGLPEPDVDRIDRIVLRLDKRNNARYIRLFVKEGVSAENPVAPTLQRDNYVYEISLAQIRVMANTASLEQLNLVDERMDEDLCGIVYSLISVPTSVFQQQWDLWFNSIKDGVEAEVIAWQLQEMANFDAWQAQEKANFDAWFASIQNILDGDIAATLAAKITTLEQGFEAHENKTATTSTPGHVKIVDSVSSESTTEAVTPRAVKQVNDTLTTHADDFTSHVRFGVTSEADAKTITLTPAPTSLVMGMGIAFANTVDNTGPVTLNVNGLGVKPVINSKGEQLKAGALRANSICTVRYNNGNFILQGDGSGQDIPNILEGLNEIRDISESYAITTAVAINGVFVGTNSAVKVTNNVNGTAVGAYYELNNGFSQTNIAGIANTLGLYVETDDSAFYSVGVSTIAKYINKGQDRVYYITMGASYNKAFNLSNEDVSDNAGHVFIRDIKNIYKVRTSDGAIIKTFNHIISGDLVEYCVNVEDQAVYIIDTQRRVKKLNFDLVQVWEKTGWAMYEPASTINIKITTGKGRHPVVMHVVNGNLDTVYFTKFDKDSGEIISSKVTRNVPLSNAVNYNSIGYFGGSLVYFDDFGMFYFDPDTYDYLSKTTSIWGETPSISTKIAPARDGKAIGIGESGSQGRLSFIKPKYKILEQ